MKNRMNVLLRIWVILAIALMPMYAAGASSEEMEMDLTDISHILANALEAPENAQTLWLPDGSGQCISPIGGGETEETGEARKDAQAEWTEIPGANGPIGMPEHAASQESIGNLYSLLSTDMYQFIPNKDYGLFVLDDENNPQPIDGHSFKLGEAFWLSAIFCVDGLVDPGRVYVYTLPAVLAGEARATGATYKHNGKAIASIQKYGGELHVVFTEYALERIIDGNPFILRFDYLDTLNASLIDDTGFQMLLLPTLYGEDTVIISFAGGNSAAIAESRPEEGAASHWGEIVDQIIRSIINYTEPQEPGGTAGEDPVAVREQPAEFTYDMRQFIPDRGYGLSVLNGANESMPLHNRVFTLGEEYTLSVLFRIDAPVNPYHLYTYKLPLVLMGKSHAEEKTLTHDGNEVAHFRAVGDQLQVEFTEYASELVEAGQRFTLRYTFDETLNESVVGNAVLFSVVIPMRSGNDTATFTIRRCAAGEGLIEMPPIEEEAEEDGGPITNEDTRIETQLGVAEQSDDRNVIVSRYAEDIMHKGDKFTLTAWFDGCNDAEYTVQWQYDAGDGWMDYAGGNNLTLQVVADKENLNYAWRILVTLDENCQEMDGKKP